MRAHEIKVLGGRTYSAYINVMTDTVLFTIPGYNWSHMVKAQVSEEEMTKELEKALRPVVGQDADLLAISLQCSVRSADIDIADWIARHSDIRLFARLALKHEAALQKARGKQEEMETLHQLAQLLFDVKVTVPR